VSQLNVFAVDIADYVRRSLGQGQRRAQSGDGSERCFRGREPIAQGAQVNERLLVELGHAASMGGAF
jgi:hypothetical protein